MPTRRLPLMIKSTHLKLIAISLSLVACASIAERTFENQFGPAEPRQRTVAQLTTDDVDYWTDVKPVLESRCVVCHACYDAPCQLKLSSIEGIERGASTEIVYQQSRLTSAQPTRLFEDAQSVEEWRALGFHPVLNEYRDDVDTNKAANVIWRMLKLKEDNPLPDGKLLPDSFDLSLNRENVCPTPAGFDKFAMDFPGSGMPYALPALSDSEQDSLLRWMEQGATYTPRAPIGEEFDAEIERWEAFLNEDSLKAQLSSRYIYEHLFLTHLYFPDIDSRQFFRLVRSSTPPGKPIDVIATRRPYDDPGVPRVYYRLTPELATIVAKTHMPYALTAARRAKWQAWFRDAEYTIDEAPSYKPAIASNPFRSFDAIPVRSRYRFLLDEARNTINAFIKGPVCRGQVALNVIRDHFWVFFVDPDSPRIETMEDFLAGQLEGIQLPAADGNIYTPITHWRRYSKQQKRLIAAADQYLSEHISVEHDLSLDLIWDGDGVNDNAALTVFRHFDSATVDKGLVGDEPQTAWLIGYPLLERIHYLLVAGYDVFGNVGHQLFSRIYMDFLRMEGETAFLLLLPAEARDRERANWYRGADKEVKEFMVLPRFESRLNPAIDYRTNNEKKELLSMLRARLDPVLPTVRDLSSIGDAAISEALAPIEDLGGASVSQLPQTVFVEIHDTDTSRWVTILRNNAHLNITSMFKEYKNRAPDEDTVTVVNGLLGSYPNALWRVEASRLPQFVAALASIGNAADYERFVDEYGVRRTDPVFWNHSDALHAALRREAPVESGVLDFGRLENR
jgi:hypothetical protein